MTVAKPKFDQQSAFYNFRENLLYSRFCFTCRGIAQLVERLHGMQEVSGSIPLTSTKAETNFSFEQDLQKMLAKTKK